MLLPNNTATIHAYNFITSNSLRRLGEVISIREKHPHKASRGKKTSSRRKQPSVLHERSTSYNQHFLNRYFIQGRIKAGNGVHESDYGNTSLRSCARTKLRISNKRFWLASSSAHEAAFLRLLMLEPFCSYLNKEGGWWERKKKMHECAC